MNLEHDPLAALAGGRTIVYIEGRTSAERIFRNLYSGLSSQIEFKGIGSSYGFSRMAEEIETFSPGLRCFFLADRDYRADDACQRHGKVFFLPVHELENLLLDPRPISQLCHSSEEEVKARLCQQAQKYRFLTATECLLQLELEKPTSWPELGKNPNRFSPDPAAWAEWIAKNVRMRESLTLEVTLLAQKITGYIGFFEPFTWGGPWKAKMPGKEILSGAKQASDLVRGLSDKEFCERIAEEISLSQDSQGFPLSESLRSMNDVIKIMLNENL